MKILFFSDNFRPESNAAASHVYERAVLWASWGHQVTVLCSAPNFPEGVVYPGYKNRWRFVEYVEGVRVVRVKTFMAPNKGFLLRILDFLSFMVSSLFFAFFEDKPDVVVSTSPHLLTPVGGLLYAKARGVPHVFELRDLWPASMLATRSISPGLIYNLLEKLELALYRQSDRIIAFTGAFKRDLADRAVPESKIDVVINGTNLKLFKPHNKDQALKKKLGLSNKFIIGYIGTHGLAQGLSNVIECAARIRQHRIHFLFVGSGAERQKLIALANGKGVDNVLFVSRKPKEQMPAFWSICDVALVHLRNDELFTTVIPSKIFEAMAMAKPILYVAPDGEGSAIIRKNKAGFIVAPDKPEEMAREIETLYKNRRKLAAISKHVRSTVNQYSRENQARAHLNIFERVVKSRNNK